MKVDWEPRLCPGGCGHMHRECCDSVVFGDHQSACPWVAEFERTRFPDRAAHLRDGDPDDARV